MPRLKQSICKTHSLALVQIFKNLSILQTKENEEKNMCRIMSILKFFFIYALQFLTQLKFSTLCSNNLNSITIIRKEMHCFFILQFESGPFLTSSPSSSWPRNHQTMLDNRPPCSMILRHTLVP